MIANDARCMVYDAMITRGLTIDKDIIELIDDNITSAAENLRFNVAIDLYPIDTNNVEADKEKDNIICAYYHSLGYDCYMKPFNGMHQFVVSW